VFENNSIRRVSAGQKKNSSAKPKIVAAKCG
jgi:hypothetical protein